MSNILGIHGHNISTGTETLFVGWKDTIRYYNGSGWTGTGVSLTLDTQLEMRTFLDELFATNGTDAIYNYDNSSWTTSNNVNTALKAKFIEEYNASLYLGNIKISDTPYTSRVWFSELPNSKNDLHWGIQAGTDLAQTASSAVVTSSSAMFITENIKVGDPVVISSGANAGKYTVKTIDSETQITLTTNLSDTDSSSSYWVGSNYFDVATDDGDTIMGFGKNSSEILIFKRNSLHRFNSVGKELRQVRGAPGTTSRGSIVNLGDFTFYYHPSGVYVYNGGAAQVLSNPLNDIISGISSSNYTLVVGWSEEQRRVCLYVGDVTLSDGDTISNCVLVYDIIDNVWTTRSLGIDIKCAAEWLESNVPTVYVGDDSSQVYKMNDGTDFNTSAIPFQLEANPIFPLGPNAIVDFNRLHVFIDNGPHVQVLFKLVYKPTLNDGMFDIDKDWRSLVGSAAAPKSEFIFPSGSRASGVILKFVESSTYESFLIEKCTIYYSNPSNK